MRIGKLILHYNTPELTADLCRMVPDAIVIDNGSDIGREILWNCKNEVIRLEKNYGFTIGWNKGIKAVYDRFDAFWLMNSDIEISEKTIIRITSLLLRPEVSMITPSFNCWIKQVQNQRTNKIREVSCIEFTAPVIKKSVFEKIGFFDERFPMGYGVEFDFCLRMKKKGLKIYVDDQTSFIHKEHQTIKGVMKVNEYSHKAMNELRDGLASKYGPEWNKILTRELKIPLMKAIMKKVALYTTIFGDYTKLLPVPSEVEADADLFCITDNPDIVNPGGWKIICPGYPRKDLNPRMRAKFFKMFPGEVKEMRNYETFIFIDGSIEITSGDFVKYCLKNIKNDILLFKHPARNCIYDEVEASVQLEKYKTENLKEQIDSYRDIYPRHGGLYACGVLVTKNTQVAHQVMGAWWWENIKYSYQDQISFPVICKLLKFQPSVFPDNQMKNRYFKHHWRDDKQDLVIKKDEKCPKVDILMSIFGTPLEFVKQCFDSIFAQTYPEFKIIIVDDNNPKGELTDYLYGEIASRTCCVTVVKTKENKGVAAALDYGLSFCQGDLVLHMDSDDIARPEWISKQVEFFMRNPSKVICGVQIQFFNEKGPVRPSNHPLVITKEKAKSDPGYWFTNHPGIAFRRETVMELGGYGDTPPKFAEDYALWIKFLKAGYQIYNLPDVLMDYRLPPVEKKTSKVIRPEEFIQKRKSKEWFEFLEKQKRQLYE